MAFDVGSVVAHVKADITDFQNGMEQAKKLANGLQNTLGGVGDSLISFGKSAAILTGLVGGGLVVAGKMALDSAGKFEQYQIAFTTLLKDQKKAADAIQKIQEDAAKTPFELAPLVAANQRLISAGVSAKNARVDIINLGNAISATGGGNAELERLSTNLQQIQAVGKASALDIKQFAFAGINVYQLLAESTGKTVAQVKDMEITYEDLSKAFAKASEKGGMFEGAMEKQSKSLNGLMSTLHDVISIGLTEIITKSGAFDAIREAVAQLIPFLENYAVPKLIEIFKTIGNVFMAVKEAFESGDLGVIRDMLNQGKDSPLTIALEKITGALIALADWISNNQDLVFAFLKGLAVAFGALLIIGTISLAIAALTNPLVLVALAIAALYTAWETNFLGIRDVVDQVIPYVVDFFNNILIPAINVLVEFWKFVWPFVAAYLKTYWDTMVFIIKASWELISGIFKIALALIQGDWQKAWEEVKNLLQKEWNLISGILNEGLNFLGMWGHTVYDKLVQPFVDAWNKIQDLVNKIKDALDFTKRHSPSVVDIVNKGVREVNRALEGLDFGLPAINPSVAATVSPAGSNTNVTQVSISLDGAVIADEFSAEALGEKLGDSIIRRLQQNVRF